MLVVNRFYRRSVVEVIAEGCSSPFTAKYKLATKILSAAGKHFHSSSVDLNWVSHLIFLASSVHLNLA